MQTTRDSCARSLPTTRDTHAADLLVKSRRLWQVQKTLVEALQKHITDVDRLISDMERAVSRYRKVRTIRKT